MLEYWFNRNIENFLEKLEKKEGRKKFLVALSGGSDSMALLKLACNYPAYLTFEKKRRVSAIHINHGISPNAEEWENLCKEWCDIFKIDLKIFRIKIKPGAGLEERARKARYAIFEKNLQKYEVLLMGHHQDDLLETFLINLFRGSSSRGLSSIPASRPLGKSLLFRPFLDRPKTEILEYLQTTNLNWVEDESNKDTSILRNYLRLEILPKFETKFSNLRENLLKTVELSKSTEALLADLARQDLEKLDFDFSAHTFNYKKFCTLSAIKRNNILRYIQKIYDFQPISSPMLENLNTHINSYFDENFGIFSWADIEMRVFQNLIYIQKQEFFQPIEEDFSKNWTGDCEVEGVKKEFLPKLPVGDYKITGRKASAKIFYKGMNRKAKKLMQEKKLAPWVRDQQPFIWQKDKLIAIGKEIISDSVGSL